MKRLFVSILILCAVGCVTTWPDACTVSDGVRVCKCKALKFSIDNHPEKPAPAGVVTIDCDGSKLPIDAVGDKVNK